MRKLIAEDIVGAPLLYIKYITNEDLLYSTGNSMLCNDLYGKRIFKRVDICLTDSLCYIPETSTQHCESTMLQ